MRSFASRHPAASFGVMSLFFSLLLLPLHILFPEAGVYAVSFTQLGPLAAVLLLTFLLPEKGILRRITKTFRFPHMTWKWAVAAIAMPGMLVYASGTILSRFGSGLVPWTGSPLFYALSLLGILVGAMAEEIGWRGYLLPEFQKKHPPLRSAVYTGIIWGVWHLNFTGGIPGFLFYTVTIIETSILMTWIYNRTGGNLSLMVIYHVFFNLFSRMLLWQRFRLELFVVESIVFGIACLYLLHADRKGWAKMRAQERSVG